MEAQKCYVLHTYKHIDEMYENDMMIMIIAVGPRTVFPKGQVLSTECVASLRPHHPDLV